MLCYDCALDGVCTNLRETTGEFNWLISKYLEAVKVIYNVVTYTYSHLLKLSSPLRSYFVTNHHPPSSGWNSQQKFAA